MLLIAALPMYDLPELRPWTDRLWSALRDRLRATGTGAPDRLTTPADLSTHWRDPTLLLSQSCGYPLLSLPAPVRVVATPVYDAPGCDGADYRSAIVVRCDDPATGLTDLRGRICALNARDSNSGMNLLRARLAPLAGGRPFFREVILTASHAASLRAVASGEADIAAIDCVTLALLQQARPASTDPVRILDWTPSSPGLPLITAADDRVLSRLRTALDDIVADPTLAPVRHALRIIRFERLPPDAYDVVRALENTARAAAYPDLV